MKLVIGIVRPEKSNDVLGALFRHEVRGVTMTRVQGAVAAKQILKWQGVLPNSIVRLPLVEPDEAEIETIRGDLAEAGLVFS